MSDSKESLLEKINSPKDIKELGQDKLMQLCAELRQFIIDVVSSNPGHFAASLGVVELTVALHYVYNTPYDNLIWDVGHQAYGHKILTGRRDQFHTNRKYKGISGFPKPSESVYDAFGVGHSSTSISAALGMAVAAALQKEDKRKTVAIIGDGSMTAGLAFEGLNNAGIEKSNLLVILNDNNMAIDPNVGALSNYLLDISTSHTYNKLKDEIWKMLGILSKIGPNAQKMVQKLDNAVKSALLKQSNLFESMNFRYFGPVDGHDVNHLVKVLQDLQDISGPKLLHIITTKGKGFKQAEENQTIFHAPGKFDKITGKIFKPEHTKPQPPKYQDVFGHTLLELAEKNTKIVGITPAMPSGSSMKIMMEKIPERTFDVGIAEQHAVTFSAGMAARGLVPFCNIYSSFMQRAYDQVIHDVALQNLPVIFCLDRGGLVGSDGATHHGAYDLAYFRAIPNIIVSAPMDEIELRNLMYTAQLRKNRPFSIRYPRGRGVCVDWKKDFEEISIGKGRKITDGKDIAIISIGHIGNMALEAIRMAENDNIHCALYDMRFLKPIDEEILHQVFMDYNRIITLEDGTIKGGLGSAVLEFMAENNYHAHVKIMGIPDEFIDHGSQQELYSQCQYDANSVFNAIKQLSTNEIKQNIKESIRHI